jgi:hypothetical protein
MNDTNFCCAQGALGCLTATLPLSTAQSNDVLAGWPAALAIDGTAASIYSSNLFATTTNDRGTYLAAWLPARPAAGYLVSQVELEARMSGTVVIAFPATYHVFVTNSGNTAWVDQGLFSTQPNSSGLARVTLPAPVRTQGVLIVPEVLGLDDNGHAYFQLAELRLRP